jgi:hypothetical protein
MRELEQGIIMTLLEICQHYAPYHTMPEFAEGFDAYEAGIYINPYVNVAGQAWDRGLEAAMRWERIQCAAEDRRRLASNPLDFRSAGAVRRREPEYPSCPWPRVRA